LASNINPKHFVNCVAEPSPCALPHPPQIDVEIETAVLA
jgi:hypothetical protein